MNPKEIKNNNILGDISTGFMWVFLKACILIYRFIKYVWYGLLWPFVGIVIFVNKVILRNIKIDLNKLIE